MPYFILFLSLIFTIPTYSQNSFGIAGTWGNGITFPSVNSYIEEFDQSTPLRITPSAHIGISAQYIIGNKFGIETGVLICSQGFTLEPSTHIHNTRMDDFYVPAQVLYRIDHPTNPYHHFTFLAGTGLHWLTTAYSGNYNIVDFSNTIFVPCIDLGVRMGGEKRRAGRLEYGLDYQFSPKGQYSMIIDNNNGLKTILHSTISQLSFKILYFFWNTKLSADRAELGSEVN